MDRDSDIPGGGLKPLYRDEMIKECTRLLKDSPLPLSASDLSQMLFDAGFGQTADIPFNARVVGTRLGACHSVMGVMKGSLRLWKLIVTPTSAPEPEPTPAEAFVEGAVRAANLRPGHACPNCADGLLNRNGRGVLVCMTCKVKP